MTFFNWFKEQSGIELNAEQRKAIEASEGAVLVVAGAGTGKTSMITAKASYLVREKKFNPERLLMLTFSREAARHMKEEIEKILPGAQNIRVSTFHAFCFDFLQDNARKTGVSENSNILDEIDAAIMLHREFDIPPEKAKFYISSIEKAKDLSLTLKMYEDYIAKLESQLKKFRPKASDFEKEYQEAQIRLNTIHLEPVSKMTREEKRNLKNFIDLYSEFDEYSTFLKAWKFYEEIKAKKRMLDYADLNKRVLDYAAEGGDEELSELYDYIIVDEFQDTNRQQFDLLKILAAKHGRITVVGDENQAIYAFRGAYANNLEAFEKEFKAKRYALTLNYRSTDTILNAAHRLIRNNYDNPEEAVLLKSAKKEKGEKVRLVQTMDPKEQARRLVEEIEALHSSGVPYNEIAVLFRSHSSSSNLQNALDRRGLPYQLVSGAGFLRRPEVRTALAFLYVIANVEKPRYGADPLWWRLMHYKYGLTNQDSHVLAQEAQRDSVQNVLMGKIPDGLSEDGKTKIGALHAKITELRKSKNKPLADLLLDVYEATGLSRWFSHDATSENRLSLLNLRYLHDLALKFQELHGSELHDFIDYIEVLGELGEDLEAQQIANTEGIVLMTCHASKGLEFGHVFLIDLVKDKFPLTRGGSEPLIPDGMDERYGRLIDLEDAEKRIKDLKKMHKEKEERRLAYVAFTRARKTLNLCFAKFYGENDREPSKFLKEIGFSPDAVHDGLTLIEDEEIKAREILKDTDLERKKAEIKKLLLSTIDSEPSEALYNLLLYEKVSGHKLLAGQEAQRVESEAKKILQNINSGIPNGLKFNPEAIRFSYTSLGTYEKCPKKYELSQLLRMPSRLDDEEGEGALGFGSFVHEVLEIAVKNKIKARKEIDGIAKEVSGNPDYRMVDLKRAIPVFDVFWTRQNDRIGSAIMVEQKFGFNLDGLNFTGKIDRVDMINEKKKEVEIIDYKTGGEPSKENRARQLLLYALAFQLDPKLKESCLIPKRLTLELLEQEKPRTFELAADGEMINIDGRCEAVNIEQVKQELLALAKGAARDYERGFAVSEDDATCKTCAYKLYCPKWE
ncbi:MAG: ATP-dependent DNA helicase [Candidatus Aenigmatarchaeota archaeon]